MLAAGSWGLGPQARFSALLDSSVAQKLNPSTILPSADSDSSQGVFSPMPLARCLQSQSIIARIALRGGRTVSLRGAKQGTVHASADVSADECC